MRSPRCNFSLRRFDAALAAAERAHALRPDDLFINTTLSRVWMEKGDKAKAEHFGAQAKIQSWKEQLKGSQRRPRLDPPVPLTIILPSRGCSLAVKLLPSKQVSGVRFPAAAPASIAGDPHEAESPEPECHPE